MYLFTIKHFNRWNSILFSGGFKSGSSYAKSSSVLDCIDPSFGSLRHSSIQGIPPSVAMTPDIEQKLLRMRNSDCSPETSGLMSKVIYRSLYPYSNKYKKLYKSSKVKKTNDDISLHHRFQQKCQR